MAYVYARSRSPYKTPSCRAGGDCDGFGPRGDWCECQCHEADLVTYEDVLAWHAARRRPKTTARPPKRTAA